MVHARSVEEATPNKKDRDTKRARPSEGGSTNIRIEIQDKPRLRRGSQMKFHPNFLRLRMKRFLS